MVARPRLVQSLPSTSWWGRIPRWLAEKPWRAIQLVPVHWWAELGSRRDPKAAAHPLVGITRS